MGDYYKKLCTQKTNFVTERGFVLPNLDEDYKSCIAVVFDGDNAYIKSERYPIYYKGSFGSEIHLSEESDRILYFVWKGNDKTWHLSTTGSVTFKEITVDEE